MLAYSKEDFSGVSVLISLICSLFYVNKLGVSKIYYKTVSYWKWTQNKRNQLFDLI